MNNPKFLVDEMLGTLARWLRVMGYDAKYVRNMVNGDILKLAHEDSRILLTRDKELAKRSGTGIILLKGNNIIDQLGDLIYRLDLIFDKERTRCTICNYALILADKNKVEEHVPARVLENHQEFLICPRCERIYWKGTHWIDICNHIGEAMQRAKRYHDPR